MEDEIANLAKACKEEGFNENDCRAFLPIMIITAAQNTPNSSLLKEPIGVVIEKVLSLLQEPEVGNL